MSRFSARQPFIGLTSTTLILLVLLRSCFAKSVPANFVFGDSLVEAGNNNYIPSLSKANFIPNGIDFGGPTGRFTNGRTIIDIIGKFSPNCKHNAGFSAYRILNYSLFSSRRRRVGFRGLYSSIPGSDDGLACRLAGGQLCFRWRWNP